MFMRSGYSAHTRSSGTQDHYLAPRVVLGRRHAPARPRREAQGGRLALESTCRQAVQKDDVVLDGPLAGGVDRLAPALEHEPGALGAHRRRLARVDDPVLLADV